MKGNNGLISLALLINIIGVFALTASQYVDCTDSYPNEFLDLALACPYSILPVFAPHWKTHPLLLRSSRMFYSQRVDPLSRCLRC